MVVVCDLPIQVRRAELVFLLHMSGSTVAQKLAEFKNSWLQGPKSSFLGFSRTWLKSPTAVVGAHFIGYLSHAIWSISRCCGSSEVVMGKSCDHPLGTASQSCQNRGS